MYAAQWYVHSGRPGALFNIKGRTEGPCGLCLIAGSTTTPTIQTTPVPGKHRGFPLALLPAIFEEKLTVG